MQLGSFVFLSAPDTSSPYSHIKRLRIDHDGPYVVIDMTDDKRLVKLMNVATYDVMENWVSLDRIRVSNFGLHTPQFEPLPEIVPDGCPVPENDVNMQQMDDTHTGNGPNQTGNDSKGQGNGLPAAQPRNSGDAQQTDVTDNSTSGNNSTPPTTQQSIPNFDDPVFYAKVPQPARTTRHTKLNEPTFRKIGQFLRKKVRDGVDYVKILFEGDHPSRARWIPVSDLNECAKKEMQISCLRPVLKQKQRDTSITETCIASLFAC